MLSIFQTAKRFISTILVTLIVVTSTLTILPSSARAEGNLVEGNLVKVGDVTFLKCEGKDCGNMMSFAVGAISGSAITLMASGDTATLAAVGATIGHAAIATVAPLAVVAPTVAAAAPVLVPVAATAAAGYGAYKLWKSVSDDHMTVPEK
ncbi:hypothetical protein CLI64_08245 [Nostoc sp. CENA543]|uniref:hypothetical protein n=1 Tax=Nostoc sp. CENA543 TaxID=1869241 RepID=UPI000CA3BB1E|nr:hypothetical protein [Nostoc sp. CENA543]AUT00378.1 hypothetical protein CLI64_08245 [Nostoc sp. CENA543]